MSEERMETASSHDGHEDISNTDRVSLISAAVNSALDKQRQLFIDELDSKLGQPTRTAIKTVDDFVFQKEGNKIQHKFNTERATRLSDILALVQSNRCEDAEVAIRSELEEIQQRNKLIKIADRHGWDTVREYTLHPLADNNEDAAKIRSAIARASRKRWSAKPYERRSPPISTATGTGRGQNQLFRSKQGFNNNNNNSYFAPGSCFICNLPGHFAKHCPYANRQSTTRTTPSATESRQVEYTQSSKQ